MARAIGIVDGLVIRDPQTGEDRLIEDSSGLLFRFRDPMNPSAKTFCRMAVRSGGMVVMAAVDGLIDIGVSSTVSDDEVAKIEADAADAADQRQEGSLSTPLSDEASRVVGETLDRPGPKGRGTQRQRPGKAE